MRVPSSDSSAKQCKGRNQATRRAGSGITPTRRAGSGITPLTVLPGAETIFKKYWKLTEKSTTTG